MKSSCHLAVDLGAESGRVMAGLWNGRKLKLQEVHRFPNEPVSLNGSLRWDLLRLWQEIQEGLGGAAKHCGKNIRSIGVDTWGVDYVLLSKSREMLSPAFHYRDSRTLGMMKQAFRIVPREAIFKASGAQFLEFNTLYQVLALQRDSPEILANARHFLMMPDFFHFCLCGTVAGEFTNATTTQFLDPVYGKWSRKLFNAFQLPLGMMPAIVEPGTVLGNLRSELGSRYGLGKLKVIAPATHDTGAAVAAVPTRHTGKTNWAYLSSGTWSLLGIEVQTAQLSNRVRELNLTNEGGVGGTYRLLKNIAGLWLLQQCKRSFDKAGTVHAYADLVEQARKAKPLVSLIDPDDPAFVNPPDMPEALREGCRRRRQPIPASKAALVRCVLESLALKYAVVINELEEISREQVKTIHVVGGGSQNKLLNQMTANACDCEVVAGPVEATAMGNVLTQLLGSGELGSLAELREVVRDSTALDVYQPEKAEAMRWCEARERFRKLLRRSTD